MKSTKKISVGFKKKEKFFCDFFSWMLFLSFFTATLFCPQKSNTLPKNLHYFKKGGDTNTKICRLLFLTKIFLPVKSHFRTKTCEKINNQKIEKGGDPLWLWCLCGLRATKNNLFLFTANSFTSTKMSHIQKKNDFSHIFLY